MLRFFRLDVSSRRQSARRTESGREAALREQLLGRLHRLVSDATHCALLGPLVARLQDLPRWSLYRASVEPSARGQQFFRVIKSEQQLLRELGDGVFGFLACSLIERYSTKNKHLHSYIFLN